MPKKIQKKNVKTSKQVVTAKRPLSSANFEQKPIPTRPLTVVVTGPKMGDSDSIVNKVKKAVPKGSFASVGKMIGGLVGDEPGSLVGQFAGNLVSDLFGFGKYTVRKNSIAKGSAQPTFHSNGLGMRICHREYAAEINSTTTFQLTNGNTPDSINPANPALFPWLCDMALLFEEYVFNGLVFEYRPTSGTFSGGSSASLGFVGLATQYNIADEIFSSKQEFDSYEFATSTVPFEHMIHPVECRPYNNPLGKFFCWPSKSGSPRVSLTVSGANAVGDVINVPAMYDVGQLSVATGGSAAAYTVGELWVSYDITFYKPRITTFVPPNGYFLRATTGTGTAAAPFGTSQSVLQNSMPQVPFTYSNTTLVIPKKGYWKIHALWGTGAANIAGIPTATYGSNIIAYNGLANDTDDQVASFVSTAAHITIIVRVTAVGSAAANTITFAGLTGMTGANCDIQVHPYSPYSTTRVY